MMMTFFPFIFCLSISDANVQTRRASHD